MMSTNRPRSADSAHPPVLCPVLSVGVSHVQGAVAFVDRETVAYVSGHCVATCSTDPSHRSKISEPCTSVRTINAMAMSNNHQWLALAEFMAGGQGPQVTVQGNKHMERIVSLRGPKVFKYVCLKFSADDKYIIAVGYDEDQLNSMFHVWEWQASSEPASTGQVTGLIQQISMHPKFHTNVATLFTDDVAMMRKGSAGYKRVEIEGLKKMAGATYIDHCWMSDGTLLVASSDRRMQMIDAGNVVQVFEPNSSIVSLLPLADNHVVVSMLNGKVCVYRCRKESSLLENPLSLHVPDAFTSSGVDPSVQTMSANPSGHRVACLLKHGPLLVLNVHLGLSQAKSNHKFDQSTLWEEALPSMHAGAILCMSAAAKGSFLVTASQDDLTVRVWQYRPLRLVVTHFCHHAPIAVAINPLGRELVIGFVDSCRCFSIVEGMLLDLCTLMVERPDQGSHEITKCSIAKYNPPGHLLAIVHGDAKEIVVFSTLHHKQMAVLRGHYASISDISWSEDGLYLASVSEGEVYTWHMETFTRSQNDNVKTCLNDTVACSQDFSSIVVGAGAGGIRVLSTKRQPRSKGGKDPKEQGGTDAAAAGGTGGGSASGTGQGRMARSVTVVVPGTSESGSTATDGATAAGGKPRRRASKLSLALAGAGGGAPVSPTAGNQSAPSTPTFKVPGGGGGFGSLVAPSAVKGNSNMSNMRAIISMQALASRHLFDTSSTATPGVGAPLSLNGNISDPQLPASTAELQVRSSFGGLMVPQRACLVLLESEEPAGTSGREAKPLKALIGGQSMGRARVADFPPKGNSGYQEYALHASEITVMLAHPSGRLLFSADTSGCWKLHVLLPFSSLPPPSVARPAVSMSSPSVPRSLSFASISPILTLPVLNSPIGATATAAASFSAATAAEITLSDGAGVPLPPAPYTDIWGTGVLAVKALLPMGNDDALDIVSVRQVDMSMLKEAVRELKDKLAKAAEETEYRLYEKEQEIRREVVAELERNQKEGEDARHELVATKELLERVRHDSAAAVAELRAQMEEQLAEERRNFERRLAYEIERTGTAEHTLAHTKAKFGKRLWEVEEERKQVSVLTAQKVAVLTEVASKAQGEADKRVAEALEQMNVELNVDGELNDENTARMQATAIKDIEVEQTKQDVLLAKYQLQAGLYSKTLQDNEQLVAAAQHYAHENSMLSGQIQGLKEQLGSMEALWAERDTRQRAKDLEVKDLMQRMEQGQMFTNMAANRIQELGSELEPLREAKREAQESVAKLEALQYRQAERKHKATLDHEALRKQLESLRSEVKAAKLKLDTREAYFENFATQLFRTLHTLNHDQWALIIGRLYEDFKAGKDLTVWNKYLPDNSGLGRPTVEDAAKGGDGSQRRGDGAAAGPGPVSSMDAMTQLEYHSSMLEMQAHIRHLEKAMAAHKESREKSELAQKMVIKRLVTENMTIIEESNVFKRDLKATQETVERLTSELSHVRRAAGAAAGAWPPATASQRGSDSGGGRAVSPSRTHRLARAQSSGDATWVDVDGAAAAAGPMFGGGLREMTPAEMQAAAAYNNAQRAGLASAPTGGGGGSAAFAAIPEDRPAVHAAASSDARGRGGGGGGGAVVTGDKPSGGWWLGDNTLFEVPANLETILQGSESAAQRAAIDGVPAADPRGGAGDRGLVSAGGYGGLALPLFSPGAGGSRGGDGGVGTPGSSSGGGGAVLPAWGSAARRGSSQQGPRERAGGPTAATSVGPRKGGGVFLTRGFTPQTPAAGGGREGGGLPPAPHSSGGGGDAGLGWGVGVASPPVGQHHRARALTTPATPGSPDSSPMWSPAAGGGGLGSSLEHGASYEGPGSATAASPTGARAATAPGPAGGGGGGFGGSRTVMSLVSPKPGPRPGTTPAGSSNSSSAAAAAGALLPPRGSQPQPDSAYAVGANGGVSKSAGHQPGTYLGLLQGQTKVPGPASQAGTAAILAGAPAPQVRLATLGGGFRSYKQQQ